MAHEGALAVAARQDGLINHSQALAAGMSEAAVKHALRPGGRWQRVLHGVYATFAGPLHSVHRMRAALLHAGDSAMITGAVACHLAGLRYGPTPTDTVKILVPRENRHAGSGFVTVIHTSRMPVPTYWVDSDADRGPTVGSDFWDDDGNVLGPRPGEFPMAPPARAVIDTVTRPEFLPGDWVPVCTSASGCPDCRGVDTHASTALQNTRALMCEVVQRRRASVRHLRSELDAAARRGSRLARRALGDIEAGCRSAPECELRDLVRSSAVLPDARWNKLLPGARGITPDACFSGARLVVEVDSRAWHGFGDAPERTERRRARYAALGWTVLPVSPSRLRSDAGHVLAEIEAAYRAGLARRT